MHFQPPTTRPSTRRCDCRPSAGLRRLPRAPRSRLLLQRRCPRRPSRTFAVERSSRAAAPWPFSTRGVGLQQGVPQILSATSLRCWVNASAQRTPKPSSMPARAHRSRDARNNRHGDRGPDQVGQAGLSCLLLLASNAGCARLGSTVHEGGCAAAADRLHSAKGAVVRASLDAKRARKARRDGLSDTGTARSARRGARPRRGRREAAWRPRASTHPCERGRVERSTDRRALARTTAAERRKDHPGTHLAASQGPRGPRRRDTGNPRQRLRASRRAGTAGRGPVSPLLDEGRDALAAGDPESAAETLRSALALWRGPPLVDFAYDSFAQEEIARLEDLHLAALEERIDADLALGRHDDVLQELERPRPATSAARTPPRPADARPLPGRSPGRGARGLPRRATETGRRSRAGAEPLPAAARASHPDS